MKTKKIIITIVAVLICVSFLAIIIDSHDSNKISWPTDPKNIIYIPKDITGDLNAEFVYEIKDEYDSYRDVKEEVDRLRAAYYNHLYANFPQGYKSDVIDENTKKTAQYEGTLWKYALENFTDEEIDAVEKEAKLQEKLRDSSNEVSKREYYCSMANSLSKNMRYKKLCRAREKYDAVNAVFQDCENGLITVDEALEKIDISYKKSSRPKEMRAVERKLK